MTPLSIENIDLSGQVAIVTGGGRGVGREIAQALARAGARVAIAARSQDQLDETTSLIQQAGGQAIAFALDVTDPAAIEHMLQETIRRLGPVSLLVNNAAIVSEDGLIWEADPEGWWRVLEVNLRGPFLCARAVLAGMVTGRGGRIINVSSGIGTAPTKIYTSYSVSKAALFRLTDCLAEIGADQGVSVFAISPGLVRTSMALSLPIYQNISEDEWGDIRQTGELCVFIASGQADRLSGRYLHVLADIPAMLERTDEILEKDLYALRMNTF